MNTITVNISEVKNNPNNPRVIKDDKFEKLVNSIKEFPKMLDIRPIVVNDDMIVLGGNMRLKACKAAGLKEVPIIKASELTEDEQKQFIIKDNVSGGEWDWEMLKTEWDAEQLDEWGLDLPDFEGEEVLQAEEDDFDVELSEEPFTVLGDLYEIGEHRLFCGDSTDSDQVAKLMNGEKADITFTSPPYNAGSLNITGNETTKKKYNSFDDNQTDDEYFNFLSGNINALIPHTEEIFYNIGIVENSKRSINKLLYSYNEIFKDIIYWHKSTVAPHIQAGVINNKIEFILCFGDGHRKFKNAQFLQGTYWNVIEGKNASGNEFADIHKATFPMYLPENIVSNFSRPKSIVIDCFCGTGTTMVAAHQLNRKCYGMELDPKYCDVIVKRMHKLDPSLPIKRNGEPFDVTEIKQ
jgi:DNA modification methylase